MFALFTQTHTDSHTHAQGAMQTLHAVPLSAAIFFFSSSSFFSACSPDVVSSSSPRSFAALRSVPPPGDLSQALTASGALLDWIYMICPSINGERGRERHTERERNGCLCVKSEIETRGEKIGWEVICKHKQHTGKNIFKGRPVQEYMQRGMHAPYAYYELYIGINSAFYAVIVGFMFLITLIRQ